MCIRDSTSCVAIGPAVRPGQRAKNMKKGRVSLGKVGQLAIVGQLTSITSHEVTDGHNRFTSTLSLRLFLDQSPRPRVDILWCVN